MLTRNRITINGILSNRFFQHIVTEWVSLKRQRFGNDFLLEGGYALLVDELADMVGGWRLVLRVRAGVILNLVSTLLKRLVCFA